MLATEHITSRNPLHFGMAASYRVGIFRKLKRKTGEVHIPVLNNRLHLVVTDSAPNLLTELYGVGDATHHGKLTNDKNLLETRISVSSNPPCPIINISNLGDPCIAKIHDDYSDVCACCDKNRQQAEADLSSLTNRLRSFESKLHEAALTRLVSAPFRVVLKSAQGTCNLVSKWLPSFRPKKKADRN